MKPVPPDTCPAVIADDPTNILVPIRPSAIVIAPAEYPDPVFVTVIEDIVLPTVTTDAVAVWLEPWVRGTVQLPSPKFVGFVPALNNANNSAGVTSNFVPGFEVAVKVKPVPVPPVNATAPLKAASDPSQPFVEPNKFVPTDIAPLSLSLKIVEEVAAVNEPEATFVTIRDVPPLLK